MGFLGPRFSRHRPGLGLRRPWRIPRWISWRLPRAPLRPRLDSREYPKAPVRAPFFALPCFRGPGCGPRGYCSGQKGGVNPRAGPAFGADGPAEVLAEGVFLHERPHLVQFKPSTLTGLAEQCREQMTALGAFDFFPHWPFSRWEKTRLVDAAGWRRVGARQVIIGHDPRLIADAPARADCNLTRGGDGPRLPCSQHALPQICPRSRGPCRP